MIAGYQRRRPCRPPSGAALPVLAWGGAMRFFLTRLKDWRSTPAGALVRPQDPMEYERKLAVHRAGLHRRRPVVVRRRGVTPDVTIFTDGACSGNPGPGGWGAILISGAHEREICGGEPATTNNRMELMAAIEALEALKRPCRVELHTDSQYVRNGITQWYRRLEGARLAHRRQEAGEERRPVAAAGRGPRPP